MKNLKTNLYIWALMLLGAGAARTAAQTPVDSAYERTMRQLATYKNVIIDTVDVTAPLDTYQHAYHDYETGKIHMVYFNEKYDISQSRDIEVLWGRKHVENYFAHEQTHRRNNEMYQRTILKDIFENAQYQIYDEITAIISEILKLREQMAAKYHKTGHIVITDLYGYEYANIPNVFKQKISINRLYNNNFTSDQGFIDYYTYLTYLVNNPSVLNGPVRGIEFDYILMTAVNLMDGRFSIYLKHIPTNFYQKPAYVNLIYMAGMHNRTYNDLIPDTTRPMRETPFRQFIYALEKMGFDMNDPTPEPEQLRQAAHTTIAKFKSGEITAISFDELIQQMFTFDGVKYLSECTPETRAAILKHMDKYMHIIGKKWNKCIETVDYHNMFIELSWNSYHNQVRLIQTIQNKKHR